MVRDNEVAARLVGIDVARTQVLAYVISAACAGPRGIAVRLLGDAHIAERVHAHLSLSLLTAIVIGGLGSLSGAVLGSFILVYLPVWTGGFASSLNLSSNVANNVPLAIYGIVLIVAILVVSARRRRRRCVDQLAAVTRMLRSSRRPAALPAAPEAPSQ